MATGTLDVGKKKPADNTAQMNLRLSQNFIDRLDVAADMLGIDRSSLVRLILTEKLPEYERRGRDAHGDVQ